MPVPALRMSIVGALALVAVTARAQDPLRDRISEAVVALPPGYAHHDLWIVEDDGAPPPWEREGGEHVVRPGCGGVIRAPYWPFIVTVRTAAGAELGPTSMGTTPLGHSGHRVHYFLYDGFDGLSPHVSEGAVALREAENGEAHCHASEGALPLQPVVHPRPTREGALAAWLAFLVLSSFGIAALRVRTPARGLFGFVSRRYAPGFLLAAMIAAGGIYAQLPASVWWVFGLACWGFGVLPSLLLGLAASSSGITLWVSQLPRVSAAVPDDDGGRRDDDGHRGARSSGEGDLPNPRLDERQFLRLTVALVCFAVTLLLAVGLSFAEIIGWR